MIDVLTTAKLVPGTIAVEGYPFSGKTTYIQKNFSEQVLIVPDHMLIPQKLPDFVLSEWQEDCENILKRQRYFLDIEVIRWTHIFSSKQKLKVMDRSIFSIVVYLLTRIKAHPLREDILNNFYNTLQYYFKNQQICLPEKILFMNVNFDTIHDRIGNNERNCEKFFLNEQIFNEIIANYKNILSNYYSGKVEYIKGE